ncbi:HupE/UreJ family protein [Palleronia sp. LCG004]|uniref:HupE/UreJ family protein n=1 Tax=Palleronia sp. LCG004 TaxID=3079304 RepID=UPI0029438B03|nr:HupE/UreJ family protein [Palleronia sp. LCG004]WOI57739.1 HupE/UreJ family protein [Palleronia sp. LCG004]
MTRLSLALLTTLAATPAMAHLDPAAHGSVLAGLSHPVFGLDHILAMVAVGLWAVALGQRAVWALPAAFVGAMIVGYAGAVGGVGLPFVEPMILVSVMALGLVLALAISLPLGGAVALTALFGLFHGHAHGAELGAAGALAFGAGFALSTALLHAAGVGIARVATDTRVLRALGLLTAISGASIALAG